MTKARDLANLISTGNPLSDGAISVAEISDLTASASEINKLDGVTVSTSEISSVTGKLPLSGGTLTGNLSLTSSSGNRQIAITSTNGIGSLEVGGSTAAFIDVKVPDTDDFDTRYGHETLNCTGNYAFQRASSTKLTLTSTGADVTGLLNTDNLTINGAQGTNGQVLSSTGSGVGWADAGGGAWSLLQRNAISSNTSSISYTNSLLTSTYKHYRLIISDVKMSNSTQLILRFLNGSTAITASYDFIGWRLDPPATSYFSYQNGLGSSYASLMGNTGNSDYSFSGTVDVILATGNNVPYGRSSLTTNFQSGSYMRAKTAEYAFTNYNNPLSTTMNGFQVKPASGSASFTQGTFSLYALS